MCEHDNVEVRKIMASVVLENVYFSIIKFYMINIKKLIKYKLNLINFFVIYYLI